jgi:hypothetical protein
MSSPTLQIEVQNRTTSPTVYCWVIGLSLNNNNQVMFLSSDGVTPYYPPNVTSTVQPVPQDCSIPLGPPGSSIYLQCPYIAGCRIYYCIGAKLQFFLNPGGNGPCLVEPSVTNPADPNIGLNWDFCEMTYNSSTVFANISYVDFVGIPVSATLVTTSNAVNHVSGMALNGVRNICAGLQAQQQLDGQSWTNLIVKGNAGQVIRVLSPNNSIQLNPSAFCGYFDSYVNQVWAQYSSHLLMIDTQAQWGIVSGTVQGGNLVVDGKCTFGKPSAQDIFSCSTGPFSGCADAETMCIIPRLAAAFNRGTLLTDSTTPTTASPTTFYTPANTNHYARIVHSQLLDSRGYAFPYDDVAANGAPDQCGAVYDGSPKLLTFAIGGNNAYVLPNEPIINQ